MGAGGGTPPAGQTGTAFLGTVAVEHNGITVHFSGNGSWGRDADGRPIIAVGTGTLTYQGHTPGPTTLFTKSAGNAQINPQREGNVGVQAYDARCGSFHAAKAAQSGATLRAGDAIQIGLPRSNVNPAIEHGSNGRRSGLNANYATIYVTDALPAATTHGPCATGWIGGRDTDFEAWDLNGLEAKLPRFAPVSSAPAPTDVADYLRRVRKGASAFPQHSGTTSNDGYELLLPGESGIDTGTYGRDLQTLHGHLMTAAMCSADTSQRKDILAALAGLGRDVLPAVDGSGMPIAVDGGHHQWQTRVGAIYAAASGKTADLDRLMAALGGNMVNQYFIMTAELRARCTPHRNNAWPDPWHIRQGRAVGPRAGGGHEVTLSREQQGTYGQRQYQWRHARPDLGRCHRQDHDPAAREPRPGPRHLLGRRQLHHPGLRQRPLAGADHLRRVLSRLPRAGGRRSRLDHQRGEPSSRDYNPSPITPYRDVNKPLGTALALVALGLVTPATLPVVRYCIRAKKDGSGLNGYDDGTSNALWDANQTALLATPQPLLSGPLLPGVGGDTGGGTGGGTGGSTTPPPEPPSPAPAPAFGTVVQSSVTRSELTTSPSAATILLELKDKATAGNLIILMLALDKDPGAISPPPNMVQRAAFRDTAGGEISGYLFTRFSDGSETAFSASWPNAVRASAHLLEIAGPWDANLVRNLVVPITSAQAKAVTVDPGHSCSGRGARPGVVCQRLRP